MVPISQWVTTILGTPTTCSFSCANTTDHCCPLSPPFRYVDISIHVKRNEWNNRNEPVNAKTLAQLQNSRRAASYQPIENLHSEQSSLPVNIITRAIFFFFYLILTKSPFFCQNCAFLRSKFQYS